MGQLWWDGIENLPRGGVFVRLYIRANEVKDEEYKWGTAWPALESLSHTSTEPRIKKWRREAF